MRPRIDKAPSVRGAKGFGDQHCSQENTAPVHAPQAKRLATIQAALAFYGGYTVHELRDGQFHVCRTNTFHHCIDVAALEALAKQAGAI